ncbi:MAG: hypothetical protein JWQ65_708 [Devosia sp.]|nr:hypothetical protein [Devosia sp.]
MLRHSLVWSGTCDPYLTGPTIERVGHVTIARHGGNADRGARKNEDGAYLLIGDDWVFVVILDAHNTGESSDALLSLLTGWQERIVEICDQGLPTDFRELEATLTELLLGKSTSDRMGQVRGETALLACFQRDAHLMWFSIGDNSLYILHPQLARLGQYSLSVRNYFEWVGERSSLANEVPCYSSGVRQLRSGINTIVLTTDGILEFGDRPYDDPRAFNNAILGSSDLDAAIAKMALVAHDNGAVDSTTLLAWQVDNAANALWPSS